MIKFRTISNLIILTLFSTQITIANPLSDTCIVLQINQTIQTGNDDVEERADGSMYLNSSDIELVNDGGNQTVGFRFTNLPIEQGMEIVEAYLHFTADDEASTNFCSLNIAAEATDNAPPFENQNNNVSNRSLTNAQTSWIPDTWTIAHVKTEKQKTPDLKELVQEVVNRPNWELGNAMAFIFSGFGSRVAAAYESDPNKSAQLVIKIAYPQPDTLLENVFINELMPSNNLILDDFGDTDDWLEIYNGNDESLFLGGLYLTDDLEDLTKWKITSAPLIPANGFAQFYADGEPEQGGNHTNFKLKSTGEFLAIVQELNGDLHILDSLTFPEVPQNISYGRQEDGSDEWVFFGEYSPNASNNGQLLYFNESVQFSLLSGHYPNSIELEMTVNDPEGIIYYTLDGNEPTQQDILYQNPVTIDQTHMVKARAYKPNHVSNQVTSDFYIINDPSELPILNVQSNPDNFWNDETGIYVHGTNGLTLWCNNVANNWNQEWERPCQLTFYEPDGTQGFQVNAGMKIGGACSRNLKMKSLNFFMRGNNYGDELIDYQIFPNQDITEFRRFKIRNGGTDWIEMLFRDGMNSLILENTVDIDLLAYRPTRVYFNGEYWGIFGIREMFNKYYVESHHGADPENIDLLGDPYGPGSHVREGNFGRYNEMMDFLNDYPLSTLSNYETFQEFVDLQQFINYHITQIYLANYDWPANNVRIWRDRDGGKFRWMLFDLDASTGFQAWGTDVCQGHHNTLAHALNAQNIGGPGWPNGPTSTFIFRKVMESEAFKNEFVQRTCTFRELIFAPERVIPMVDDLENLLLPEMERHIDVWLGRDDLGDGIPSGGSVAQWQENVNYYRDFFEDRASWILTLYQSTLGLSERFNLTFNYDQMTNGDVVLHENEMSIPFNYEGEYFKNVPIKIKAIPHAGWYFSHWLETGQTTAEIEFIGTTDQILTPIFTDSPVSTKESNLDLNIQIYPNPTNGILFLEIPELNEEVTATVFDVFGKVLLEKNIAHNLSQLELENVPSGVYLVKIARDEGGASSHTIIKLRVKLDSLN